MCSCNHSNACASELSAQLIEALRNDAFLGAVYVEGRDRRVVRGLLGEVGYLHKPVAGCARSATGGL